MGGKRTRFRVKRAQRKKVVGFKHPSSRLDERSFAVIAERDI